MPRLSPEELQAARRASGNLGGRPRKPTVSEARAAALEELVPPAIKSLRAHLADGDPTAWRAALRVMEMAFGREAPEEVEEPEGVLDVSLMTREQRDRLIQRLEHEYPELAELIPRRAA